MTTTAADRATLYGVQETNPIDDGHEFHTRDRLNMTLSQLQDAKGRVTRVRLLTEPGWPYMDISYVYGITGDGREVRVNVYRMHLAKGRGSVPIPRDIIAWAREEGVYAKGMGMLDIDGVYSILR